MRHTKLKGTLLANIKAVAKYFFFDCGWMRRILNSTTFIKKEKKAFHMSSKAIQERDLKKLVLSFFYYITCLLMSSKAIQEERELKKLVLSFFFLLISVKSAQTSFTNALQSIRGPLVASHFSFWAVSPRVTKRGNRIASWLRWRQSRIWRAALQMVKNETWRMPAHGIHWSIMHDTAKSARHKSIEFS